MQQSEGTVNTKLFGWSGSDAVGLWMAGVA